MTESSLGGSQLVNVHFARSERAVLPAQWDSRLAEEFSTSLPGECVAGLFGSDDVGGFGDLPSRSFVRNVRPAFVVVADFDGDGGATRLLIPEVRIGVEMFGFAVRWMLSPAAMETVSAQQRGGGGRG